MFVLPGATVEVRHRIGPSWVISGNSAEIRSPADPGDLVARVPVAGAPEARAALDAARAALPGWARTPAPIRADLLLRAADLLTERSAAIGAELTREEGKTLAEAIAETRRAAAIFRYHAGQTLEPVGEVYASATSGTRIHTLRQPVGVVAAITPWNFPIAIPAWKIGPALAYGNTVVFKPASVTPLTAYRLVEALIDAGLPPGVLNLVHAPGAVVQDTWLGSHGVDALSFTGSEAIGRRLQAAAIPGGQHVQLELGGKNAVVVAEDADVDRAADLIARGAFASAGQKCTATSRVIPIGSVSTSLVPALAERVARLLPGDPLAPTTTLGPVISQEAKERIDAIVGSAIHSGAQIVSQREVPARGAFSPPTILTGVEDLDIARLEVFGPVISLLPARDLDDAIRIHDSVAYGLSAAIFTRDLATADRFVTAAQAGIVHVNGETAGAEPHVPFGGMKASSSGSREQGSMAREFYTQTKTVYFDGLPGTGPFESTSG